MRHIHPSVSALVVICGPDKLSSCLTSLLFMSLLLLQVSSTPLAGQWAVFWCLSASAARSSCMVFTGWQSTPAAF